MSGWRCFLSIFPSGFKTSGVQVLVQLDSSNRLSFHTHVILVFCFLHI